jgi:hypothetical protein
VKEEGQLLEIINHIRRVHLIAREDQNLEVKNFLVGIARMKDT